MEIDRKGMVVLSTKSPLSYLLGTKSLPFTHKVVRNWASRLPRLVLPAPQGEQAPARGLRGNEKPCPLSLCPPGERVPYSTGVAEAEP